MSEVPTGSTSSGGIAPELLEIIVCPDCHGDLALLAEESLTCRSCGLTYPIVDGIPVLLVDEAQPAS